ncbi:MAG: mechanosensitive ion channel family protein [Bacteroidota bacterium]
MSSNMLHGQETDLTIEPSPLLHSPRKALHTFLHWQQKGHIDYKKAVLPFALVQGNDSEKQDIAQQLKRVLDARGLIVVYETVPNEPNYVDSLSGEEQYILFDALPEVYLVHRNGNWIFSTSTIEQTPALYQATFSSWVEALVSVLPEALRDEWWGVEIWQFLAVFVWILIGFIVRKLFEFILQNYVKKLAQRTSMQWDDDLIEGIERPSGFIVLMGFFALTYTNLQLSVTLNYYLSIILELAFSFGIIWLLFNLTDVFAKYLQAITAKTDNKLDDQLVPLIRKTLRFFVVIMGIITVLQNNGYNIASLIAGLGIGGLAVALAARDTLANFFGSITIFVDKPFRIGDWIKVGSVEGTVEEVGFRSTRVRTFYNSLVSVPNSKVADTAIDNLGLRKYRRLKTILNLTYSTTPEQMEAFVEGIKAIVQANSNFRQDYYEVHFNSFGAHSLDVLVYVFFDVPDWSTELQQRHNFLLEVLRLAKELGVEFAFPTQTLHIDSHIEGAGSEMEIKTEDELAATVHAFGPNGEQAKPDGVRIYKAGEEVKF